MITEDPLEQLAIQWFCHMSWNRAYGAKLAPERNGSERVEFRTVSLKGRSAEAVQRLDPKPMAAAVEEVVLSWHTQGSRKSISMCCYAGKLLRQPLPRMRRRRMRCNLAWLSRTRTAGADYER